MREKTVGRLLADCSSTEGHPVGQPNAGRLSADCWTFACRCPTVHKRAFLSVVEVVWLWGRGAMPSPEIV